MHRSFTAPLAMFALLLTAAIDPPAGPSQARKPATHLVEQAPVSIHEVAHGVYLVDFGRVAFGNLLLSPGAPAGNPNAAANDEVTVRFGEALKNGRVDTRPPGSVRYAEVKVRLKGSAPARVAPPADARNTRPPAVLTPAGLGGAAALSVGRG